VLETFANLYAIVRSLFHLNTPVAGGAFAVMGRMARWQIAARIWRQPLIMDFVSGTRLVGSTGVTSVTAEYYHGLAEFDHAGFMLHALRPAERLADVGANVGVFTIIGAGVCKAEVIACEPSSAALRGLADNIAINGVGGLVEVRRVAVGDEPGTLYAQSGGSAVNEMQDRAAPGYESVPVKRLDDIAAGRSIDFLKIDVVGFEYHVLRGAQHVLADPALKAVIVGCLRRSANFGASPQATLEQITSHGFFPVHYDPATRKLERLEAIDYDHKLLFIRDFEAMGQRVRSAPHFTVLGRPY